MSVSGQRHIVIGLTPRGGATNSTCIAPGRRAGSTADHWAAPPAVHRDAIPILLIEDNPVLRDGLTILLGNHGLKVIASARNAGEAARRISASAPRVILLDAELGGTEGVAVAEQLRTKAPAAALIVLHAGTNTPDVADYVHAGVSGFILKDAGMTEIVATIRAVATGAKVLPPCLATPLFTWLAARPRIRDTGEPRPATRLTAREHEVTTLIADGLSNKAIAERLHIAAHTVKSHVHKVLEKLELHTRLEVAAYAHRSGHVPLGRTSAPGAA